MTENWTNRDVERDPQGYLALQRKEREDREREAAKQCEADDLARFTRTFVANGGSEADAKAAYKALKNERAADAARRADVDVSARMRAARMRAV